MQSLVDQNPEQALSLIHDAGMRVGKSTAHAKPILAAGLGVSPRSVVLRANVKLLLAGLPRGSRRYFSWDHTTDGGKTLSGVIQTPVATAVYLDLAPLATHGFRACVTTAKGTSAWTDLVTIFVI